MSDDQFLTDWAREHWEADDRPMPELQPFDPEPRRRAGLATWATEDVRARLLAIQDMPASPARTRQVRRFRAELRTRGL